MDKCSKKMVPGQWTSAMNYSGGGDSDGYFDWNALTHSIKQSYRFPVSYPLLRNCNWDRQKSRRPPRLLLSLVKTHYHFFWRLPNFQQRVNMHRVQKLGLLSLAKKGVIYFLLYFLSVAEAERSNHCFLVGQIHLWLVWLHREWETTCSYDAMESLRLHHALDLFAIKWG